MLLSGWANECTLQKLNMHTMDAVTRIRAIKRESKTVCPQFGMNIHQKKCDMYGKEKS